MAEELRIVLRNYGRIDPLKIEDYLALGGYKSLEKARGMKPADVITEVKRSNLRGRGGAGFNAGMKWSFAAVAQAEQKYVVCNADEGEPGTYKDRIIMESDPHTLIEGMAICAYAIGADQGYIYLRGEYPFLINTLNNAIKKAKEKGILDNLSIEVRSGAGAYVCGDETAQIESLQGKRGEPRFKPPFPPVEGLWSRPTIVNNVETLANIPVIMEKGADWYTALGAASYPGSKVFTLTGDVNQRNFFEVPTNTTIRQLIYDFAGGIKNGRKLKAIQIGGTSGAIIPETLLDTPMDFDSMNNAGATLGSGAVFVMDESRDIVDVTTRIAGFFEHESCGKCTPCREGTPRIVELMEKINQGKGSQIDMALIKKLGTIMTYSCLCGLGQVAPVPVLTSYKNFPSEYEAKFGAVKQGVRI